MKNDNCLGTSSVVLTISRPYANFIHLMLKQSNDDPSAGMDSTLKMASAGSSEMLVTSYQTTRSQISQNCNLHRHHKENFISCCYLKTLKSLRLKMECLKIKNIWSLTLIPGYVFQVCLSLCLTYLTFCSNYLPQASVTKFRSKNCYIYTVSCSNSIYQNHCFVYILQIWHSFSQGTTITTKLKCNLSPHL
jgi:hypothetical protein